MIWGEFTDVSPMPFGKYKGVEMGKVPADYLDWLMGQPWISRWPQLVRYIKKNEKAITFELKEKGKIDD